MLEQRPQEVGQRTAIQEEKEEQVRRPEGQKPTRQVWLTQSKKRTPATVGRGFLEAQAECEAATGAQMMAGSGWSWRG